MPPGIINKSNFGQSFKVKSLFTERPPVQVIIFFFSVKVKTLNGQESLCIEALLLFVNLVLANTSYGPAKSKISTESNINIPTFFIIFFFLSFFFIVFYNI